MTLSFT